MSAWLNDMTQYVIYIYNTYCVLHIHIINAHCDNVWYVCVYIYIVYIIICNLHISYIYIYIFVVNKQNSSCFATKHGCNSNVRVQHPAVFFSSTTVDGLWNTTLAVLSSPPHPQISMLSLGCALGCGGQRISNLERRGNYIYTVYIVLFNIEIWGVGFYLVHVYRVWFVCPSTITYYN